MLWREGFARPLFTCHIIHFESGKVWGHLTLDFMLVLVSGLEHGLEIGWQGDVNKFFVKKIGGVTCLY